MPHDLLISSYNESMVMLSSIIRIKLWNPDTQAEFTSADPDGSGMLLTLSGSATNGTYVVGYLSLVKKSYYYKKG